MNLLKKALLTSIAIVGLSGQVSAAAFYDFNQSGDDVIGTLSGSIDLAGLTGVPDLEGTKYFVYPELGIFSSFTQFAPVTLYNYVDGPTSFGIGPQTYGSSKTGASIWAGVGDFYLDSAYVSGALLSGSMTFLDTTFLLLGVTPGSYTWTLANEDTFTVRFNAVNEVPIPAALPLLAAGLGALGITGWRRKRKLA